MQVEFSVPEEALSAIALAVREEHSVFCLEQLGVPHRVINVLYDSGIRSMSDLMHRSRGELLEIQNFGQSNLRSLFGALCRYHTIEDI